MGRVGGSKIEYPIVALIQGVQWRMEIWAIVPMRFRLGCSLNKRSSKLFDKPIGHKKLIG